MGARGVVPHLTQTLIGSPEGHAEQIKRQGEAACRAGTDGIGGPHKGRLDGAVQSFVQPLGLADPCHMGKYMHCPVIQPETENCRSSLIL